MSLDEPAKILIRPTLPALPFIRLRTKLLILFRILPRLARQPLNRVIPGCQDGYVL